MARFSSDQLTSMQNLWRRTDEIRELERRRRDLIKQRADVDAKIAGLNSRITELEGFMRNDIIVVRDIRTDGN